MNSPNFLFLYYSNNIYYIKAERISTCGHFLVYRVSLFEFLVSTLFGAFPVQSYQRFTLQMVL